jgi:hypothetical protein
MDVGRKLTSRRRKWEATAPGPDRIKLGLEFIEESKIAFERQQEEIDALHRAQEKAEARVSRIHADLKDSEKELQILERELVEIDQIERELQTLTHERDILASGITEAAGMPRTAGKNYQDSVSDMPFEHIIIISSSSESPRLWESNQMKKITDARRQRPARWR